MTVMSKIESIQILCVLFALVMVLAVPPSEAPYYHRYIFAEGILLGIAIGVSLGKRFQ